VVLAFGLWQILWFQHGMLDEWDFWAGTLGLALVAFVEVIVFVWVFKPENAWRSIHQGADIRIPTVFRFIMTYVTPVYLGAVLVSWVVQDAVPILRLERVAPGAEPYVQLSRLAIVAIALFFAVMVRIAWKRNGYDDRAGFVEVGEGWSDGAPPAREAAR
jgi:hypothetical protein